MRGEMEDKEHLAFLKAKREKLNNELIEVALATADLGKKLYELKEELRVTEIKIRKNANP